MVAGIFLWWPAMRGLGIKQYSLLAYRPFPSALLLLQLPPDPRLVNLPVPTTGLQ